MWPVADVKRNGVGKHDGDDPVDLDPLPRWKPVFIGAVVVWPKCQWPSWCDRRARQQLLAQPASGLLVRESVDVCALGAISTSTATGADSEPSSTPTVMGTAKWIETTPQAVRGPIYV